MIEVGINGIGARVPQKVLTNQDFEKMVETSDEWILTRTGIRERHQIQPDETMAALVTEAARTACQQANQDPTKLDFIISSTISPDRICPPQSFEVAREIQANQAFCFDLNAACSGFIYSLSMAESLLKTREISHGLVTAGEQITRMTDYSDRNSCVLFGDGAAALVVTNQQPQHRLLYTELGADPTLSQEVTIGGINHLLQGNLSDYYFNQNGKVVFKFAVSKIKELFETVPAKVGIKTEQIKYVIPHQANIRIIDAARDGLNAPAEFISVIERYGNTSSASIGLALNDSQARFQKGDYVLLLAFGGGLSWAAALLEW